MISEVFYLPESNFRWIDVTAPTSEDYERLTQQYELHPAAVKDCLSPLHLPKCERFNGVVFMIMRLYDHEASLMADDMRRLTNKVAIFSSERFIITIRRKAEGFMEELLEEWGNIDQVQDPSRDHLFNHLVDKAIFTYEEILRSEEDRIDDVEKRIFGNSRDASIIPDLYVCKRRASVFRRMLFLTKEVLERHRRFYQSKDPFSNDLLDSADMLYFMADGLHENANNLINLHISLASHRTNEVMRVLTIFSVFFMPLTFIVGLYGMNFEHMPELKYVWAYPAVIIAMIITAIGTYVWFRQRDWL